jgi:hypothetical protein
METGLYNSVLFNSPHPGAEVRHKLDRRAPAPPGCPGDKPNVDIQPPSIGLPDWVGKNFHPNELGHYTVASFALQTLVDTRASVLDLTPPSCAIQDEFKCWQRNGARAYASAARLNEDYKDFCAQVRRSSGPDGWSFSRVYHEGTPDETVFRISVRPPSTNYDRNECLAKMDRIINGCDGNDPNNPMNWKFGGEWVHGDYTYTIAPRKPNRHWPVPREPGGACEGWYKVFYGEYTIYGYGWATDDHGQQGLLKEARSCVGGGISEWEFEYFKEADANGNEWKATFRTPIWVRARCFNNNKVQFGAGGFTGGCRGND